MVTYIFSSICLNFVQERTYSIHSLVVMHEYWLLPTSFNTSICSSNTAASFLLLSAHIPRHIYIDSSMYQYNPFNSFRLSRSTVWIHTCFMCFYMFQYRHDNLPSWTPLNMLIQRSIMSICWRWCHTSAHCHCQAYVLLKHSLKPNYLLSLSFRSNPWTPGLRSPQIYFERFQTQKSLRRSFAKTSE